MNSPEPSEPAEHKPAEPVAARSFGHFKLLQLAGKSRRSMLWRVCDERDVQAGRALLLLLPRRQPEDADAMQRWQQGVRRAARLSHPNLAMPLEIGICERWPFVLYDAAGCETLAERMQGPALGAVEAAGMLVELLQGLAFAHEGGVAHRDLQPWMLLLGDAGSVRLLGLEVGAHADGEAHAAAAVAPINSVEALQLHALRDAARRDVLCAGLLLHLALSGKPALDEPDVVELAHHLPPLGREMVRLPWGMGTPVPEALRAIANRASDRQPRQRYRGARGLSRALEGWLQAEGAAGGGALALLIDRLHSVGALPASPGCEARAARLALMDRERTNELAVVVLQDLALAFELLRAVNSAQVRGAQVTGSGPVLTVRRAIALLGLDGVRRLSQALRAWPGPMSDIAAQALSGQIDAAKRAGRVAQALRPAGYDAEVVYLVTLLQNLGRLIAGYHFPDEWQQIGRLMQPAAAARAGEPDEPGMAEQSASYAVLGADIEAIGAAVARHWGFDDSVLHMIRRMSLSTAPRSVDNDDDMLRAVASCAIEAVDTLALPTKQQPAALRRVAHRYARALHIELRDLQDALRPSAKRPANTRGAKEADDAAELEGDGAAGDG